MTLEDHQELVKHIEHVAARAELSINENDKKLFKETLKYLLELQERQSKEMA